MRLPNFLFFILAVFVLLLCGHQAGNAADHSGRYKQLLVKIPAFTMNPGEKIVGVEVSLTGGRVTHAFFPRGWVCNLMNSGKGSQLYYCSSPHSSYAITNSAKLPTISIDDMSGTAGMTFGVEAQIELERADGQRFTKQLRESDLSISR